MPHMLQLDAVGGAFGIFGGEGFVWLGRAAELLFKLLDAGVEGDEGIRELVFNVVGIGNEEAIAAAIDDVGRNADGGGI